jgi:hypothetical protein
VLRGKKNGIPRAAATRGNDSSTIPHVNVFTGHDTSLAIREPFSPQLQSREMSHERENFFLRTCPTAKAAVSLLAGPYSG